MQFLNIDTLYNHLLIVVFKISCILLFLGRGVPNEVAGRHDGSAQVDSARFPPGETVAEWYFQDIGSHLTQPGNFAPTPFPSENAQRECERHFVNVCPPVDFLLDSAINRNFQPLQDAIRQLINITTMHTQ